MLIRCAVLLLLCLKCVKPSEDNQYGLMRTDFNREFSWWPSVHNGAKLSHELRVRRESQSSVVASGPNKESVVVEGNAVPSLSATSPPPLNKNATTQPTKSESNDKSEPAVPAPPASNVVEVKTPTNATVTDKSQVKELDLNSPGVLKRGLIVFGGFSILAIAYFVFYRRKSKNSDPNSTHNAVDANQFRYGVLQSEDRRDNLELSSVPLTMESDDDEDEDMEIFDLEQKKKSLSYVNLQTNDEDIVLSPSDGRRGTDMDNLLLDIEDANSDTLINWSNSSNKTIL